jgi:hypothetical protein
VEGKSYDQFRLRSGVGHIVIFRSVVCCETRMPTPFKEPHPPSAGYRFKSSLATAGIRVTVSSAWDECPAYTGRSLVCT